MAYNAVAQVEVASDSDSDSHHSLSPSFSRLQRNAEIHLDSADKPESHLGAIYRSMTSSNYDVVEADDYDADPSPNHHSIPPLNTTVARHSPPPLRSASSDAPIPLNHPTPDLQSLQGAYVGNVERLEQSAERLSSSTADIASEIRKLDQEQKRRSYSSASNSIMRNGAFSPGASLTRSPHGSTRSRSTRRRSISSGSYLAQVPEPAHDDGHFVDQFPPTLPIAPQLPLLTPSSGRFYGQYDGPAAPVSEEIERPGTAASGDTYQQARTLFTDFDGVHFATLELAGPGRQMSLNQPPLASNPESYKELQAGQNMVYYPAPVPRMLNLPPKLSRKPPAAEREKRRTQLLTTIVAEDRKAEFEEGTTDGHKEKRQSTLPPQLRASVFFDRPSTTLELEVKQDSAVATLDSILDASAHAPVSAFTDHPYAGHVGSYVYGKERKTLRKQKSGQNSQLPMGQQQSTIRDVASEGSVHSDNGLQEESERLHENESEGSDESGNEGDVYSQESDDDDESDYVGPPNTLLAELELRKHELAQRRRTVVSQFTPGMKNTLLELDAMAQKQSDKRRRRPVTLAWDSRHTADDDDVPLAMLYPDQINADDDQPRGLMEKHHVEEHEPLSTRRARLRGEPIPEKRPVTFQAERTRPAPEPATDETGEDGETLAERLRRLKGLNPSETEFSNILMAEFDNRLGSTPTAETAPVPQRPEEETLAQRRLRLQKESGAQPGLAKNPQMRRSMAALPQVRASNVVRKSSHDAFQQPGLMQQYGNRMPMQQFPTNMAYPPNQPPPPPYSHGPAYPPPYGYTQTMMAMHNMGYPMPNAYASTMTRQPVDPNQREVIDRWRQSIR